MPITYYKCALCKMQRDSYEEAERCEKTHLQAQEVKALEYVLGPYPYRVSILFPDGKEREYTKVD